LELGKEQNATAIVTRDCRAVAEHEPPAFTPPVFWHRGEQAHCFLVCERE
jgi:hypothetical protein